MTPKNPKPAAKAVPLSAIDAWRSLSPAVRDAIADAVAIGERIDTTEPPVLVLFPIGSTAVVLSSWTPDRAGKRALSEAFRPRGGTWFDPSATTKDGAPVKTPAGWPAIVGRAAWFGPVAGMLDAAQTLRATGWTVRGATDLAAAESIVEEAAEAAPKVLARLRIPGSSSRSGATDGTDAPVMSAAAVAEALASLD